MADSYVCSGATMKCSMGTSQAKLTVLPTRTVLLTGQPMANISDHLSMVNLAPFGRCRSMGFPATASATAAAQGTLTPMPCMHNTPFPWMGGKNDYTIKGDPALLKSSTCQCMWGGTISLVTDGQTNTGSVDINRKTKDHFEENQTKDNNSNIDSIPLLEDKKFKKRLSYMMSKAKEIGPEIQKIAEQIANKYGATCTPINYKTESSIKRKSGGDLEELNCMKDLVRTTIIVPTSKTEDKTIEKILTELSKLPNLHRIKVQKSEKDPLGYSGNIVNLIGTNGLFAEIQVNTEYMIYAKEKDARSILGEESFNKIKEITDCEPGLGHKYYEEWRVLDACDPEKGEIERASRLYYSTIRNKIKKKI